MHKWPEPPSIEECINAKPATISATSCGKKGEESPKISPKQHPIEVRRNCCCYSYQYLLIVFFWGYNNNNYINYLCILLRCLLCPILM